MKAHMVEYKHPEAYCLMLYRCEKCGKLETLWNSRDGVTPFMIGCPKCGGWMKHICWNMDRQQRDYKPSVGQRIFIDMTDDMKQETAKKMLQRIRADGSMKDSTDEQIIKEVMKGFQVGEPCIITYKGEK